MLVAGFVLSNPIDVVFELDFDLSLAADPVLNEWAFEQLLSGRPLSVVFDEDCFDEVVELFVPLLGFESRRRIAGNQE